MTSIIIEVETDEGVIGLGECAAWPSYGLTIHVLESIRRLAVGEDALRPELLWRRLMFSEDGVTPVRPGTRRCRASRSRSGT